MQVIRDANGNGQIDTDEPILTTAMVDSGLDSITLTFTSPLDLHPNATTYVLVALQIDGSGTGTRGVAPRRTGWLLLSPVVFALALFPWRRRLSRWMGLSLLLVMCSLALTHCDGGNEELSVIVVIPAQSVRGQGAVSGPLTGPETPLVGPTVIVSQ